MDIEESGHTDVASAKNQVKIAMSALEKMRAELTKLDDEGSLPSWWTNKVAIAVDKLDGMADYLDTQVEDINLDEKAGDIADLKKLIGELNKASKMHLAQSKRVEAHVQMMSDANRPVHKRDEEFKKQLNMLHQIVGELEKASDAHKGQSSNIKKHLDYMGEGNELDELVIQAKDVRNRLRGVKFDIKDPDDKDGPFVITVAKKDLEKSKNAMRTHPEYKNKNIKVVSEENEMENENELDEDAKMAKQSDDNLKSMMKKFRDMEKKDPKEPSTKFMIKRIGKEMKKRGLKEMNEDNELIQRVANAISSYEAKSSTGYELYHKDFSSAMQHAYAFAKKKYGITIDPKEIDDKVATGPKKPSKDKTNKYRLKGDKGQVQIQVTNLDNKRFELNMYKEEVEMDEAKYEYDDKVVKISKKEFRKVHKDYKNSTKGKERMLVLDPKTQGTISVPVQFEEVELDENAAVKALKNQADVSNPTDKKFFQKAAELLKKKDFVALGQHLYDYDTAPSEFAMSAIRDKDRASFKKMYGDQKGYFRNMKPKGLKEGADENIQRVANAISFSEAKRMSPAARARRDALRDIGGRGKDDDDDVKATDADREKADRNIINKIKKAADVKDEKGSFEIKFDKGPSKKITSKMASLILKKLDRMKPADKLKFQKQAERSYADFLKAVKGIAK